MRKLLSAAGTAVVAISPLLASCTPPPPLAPICTERSRTEVSPNLDSQLASLPPGIDFSPHSYTYDPLTGTGMVRVYDYNTQWGPGSLPFAYPLGEGVSPDGRYRYWAVGEGGELTAVPADDPLPDPLPGSIMRHVHVYRLDATVGGVPTLVDHFDERDDLFAPDDVTADTRGFPDHLVFEQVGDDGTYEANVAYERFGPSHGLDEDFPLLGRRAFDVVRAC